MPPFRAHLLKHLLTAPFFMPILSKCPDQHMCLGASPKPESGAAKGLLWPSHTLWIDSTQWQVRTLPKIRCNCFVLKMEGGSTFCGITTCPQSRASRSMSFPTQEAHSWDISPGDGLVGSTLLSNLCSLVERSGGAVGPEWGWQRPWGCGAQQVGPPSGSISPGLCTGFH